MSRRLNALLFIASQIMTMQTSSVVHLAPHRHAIEPSFGGKLLELINAPASVQLPDKVPKTDSQDVPWHIDIKNLGPGVVTLESKSGLSLRVSVGQTVHICAKGDSYVSTPQ